MAEEDKVKTSLLGLLQFTTMPFGLSGAPATFKWLMDQVLRGTEAYAEVYLDDIIIYRDTWEQHLENIWNKFKWLRHSGLTIKLNKCSFGASECIYLGHQIGKGGAQPEATKVWAINDVPRLKTKKEVYTFLGLIGYYRQFIRNFATKAEPLTQLTKKGEPENVNWTTIEKEAFKTFKQDLSSSVMLKNPDFTATFQLQTDVYNVGVGAVFSQGGD